MTKMMKGPSFNEMQEESDCKPSLMHSGLMNQINQTNQNDYTASNLYPQVQSFNLETLQNRTINPDLLMMPSSEMLNTQTINLMLQMQQLGQLGQLGNQYLSFYWNQLSMGLPNLGQPLNQTHVQPQPAIENIEEVVPQKSPTPPLVEAKPTDSPDASKDTSLLGTDTPTKIVMKVDRFRGWTAIPPHSLDIAEFNCTMTNRVDPLYLSVSKNMFGHMKYKFELRIKMKAPNARLEASLALFRFDHMAKLDPSSNEEASLQNVNHAQHIVPDGFVDYAMTHKELVPCRNMPTCYTIECTAQLNKHYSFHNTNHLYGLQWTIRNNYHETFTIRSAPFKIYARKRNNAPLTAGQKKLIASRQHQQGAHRKRKRPSSLSNNDIRPHKKMATDHNNSVNYS